MHFLGDAPHIFNFVTLGCQDVPQKTGSAPKKQKIRVFPAEDASWFGSRGANSPF